MSDINYEVEVKKVHPDARCEWFVLQEGGLQYFIFKDNASNKPCLNNPISESEVEAWQSAYNNLVKEGKI